MLSFYYLNSESFCILVFQDDGVLIRGETLLLDPLEDGAVCAALLRLLVKCVTV